MKKFMLFCGILCFPLCGFAAGQLPQDQVSQVQLLQQEKVLLEQSHLTDDDYRKQEYLDSIVVSAQRASIKTPVTFTQVSGKELGKNSQSHSLPMMLGLQPSVVATTEGGLGLGYTKMSVRGSDETRTNVTINGIAMNDSESQQVFWVNLPSIHSFLGSAQLQRGVGTSSNGAGAFGASLNLHTSSNKPNAYGAAEFSVGSYGTFMSSVATGTGISKSGFSFDAVYSHGQTEGYIRNAKADLNSLYLSGKWQGKDKQLKLSYIMGDQVTGITWEGVSPEMYKVDRRYNIAGEYYDEQGNVHYYDNETDNYQQHYIQAAYTQAFGNLLSWNTILNFTKGDGYYENYKGDTKFSKYGMTPVDGLKKSDFIVQQAMDNSFYTANTALVYDKVGIKASAAVTYSFYDGNHFGDMLWCKHVALDTPYRWYENTGTKQDYSAYVKAEWDFAKHFTAFADMQYRGVSYELAGMDKDFAMLNWKHKYNFFNPKGGITFSPDEWQHFYASVAVAHREPSRSDIKESIKSGAADAIKAERLVDYEIGYRFAREKVTLSANVYFMEYKDQLVATGKLSEVGYVIKENIPCSYRRGLELAGAWQALSWLRFDGNLTLSRNKAVDYTAYVDTYDNATDWNPVAQSEVFFEKTNLILSPEVIGMLMANVTPGAGFDVALSGKFVGKQYMDNFNSQVSEVPAYFVASLNLGKEFSLRRGEAFSPVLRLSVAVDNLLNNKYYSYGWIYQAWFADGSTPYVEQGVYAQAPTNFMVKAAFKF